jgi:hypothetical protein
MATQRQSSASGDFRGEYSVCKAAGIRRMSDNSDNQGRAEKCRRFWKIARALPT